MAADVVVINHHLFFADMAVRESGVAELLPTVRITVFDEAHQLNEIGVNFLGQQLSTVQLLDLCRDVLATGLQLARGLVDWPLICSSLEKATRDLRLAAGMHRGSVRLRWVGFHPEGVEPHAWTLALQTLSQALVNVQQGLDMVTELAPDFQRLADRTRELLERAALFADLPNPEGVRWAEVSSNLTLVESPLDISQAFEAMTRTPTHSAAAPDAHPLSECDLGPHNDTLEPCQDPSTETDVAPAAVQRAFIFTSATLGDEPSLRWFTEPCGLSSAQVLQVSSPFDYAQQAALYVPTHLPRPGDLGHAQQVAELVQAAVQILGGRTLVLTTTLNAMRQIGEYLQAHCDAAMNIEVLVQGQSPKRRLMERFRQGGGQGDASGLAGCVLVASASFWEGFDVPGDALQLVIIDKLPFPPPGDPLFEARSQRITLQGRSAFADHSLPEAAVSLKQGAGRLIRSETDRGILVVCDNRLVGMSYGRKLVKGLPPMRRLENHESFLEALRQLTTDASHGRF
jgi:ATP-dependent DNA helicase DinG